MKLGANCNLLKLNLIAIKVKNVCQRQVKTMCGYCFEVMHINDHEQYLCNKHLNDVNNFNIVGYLQELPHLHEIQFCYLEEGPALDYHVIFQARIAMSAFEESCFKNVDNPFFNYPIHLEYLNRRTDLLAINPNPALLAIASHLENETEIAFSFQLLKQAEACLHWFSNHFLDYKSEVEFEQNFHKYSSTFNWDDWYLFTAEIQFSLQYIIRFNSDFALFKKLAIESPRKAPLVGIDLWILRKSFLHSTKQFGITFLSDFSSQIQASLVYYAILHNAVDHSELPSLSKLVFNEMAISNADIHLLVERLISERNTTAI